MCKISTICRFHGSVCRAFFAVMMVTTATTAPLRLLAQGIDLPPPPSAAPPPVIPPEKDPARLRKIEKKERQAVEVKEVEAERQTVQEVKQEEKAKAEARKPRPLYGFTELSLLQPKAVVSSGRSNYVSDLTVHFSTYIRTFWNDDADKIQPWLGVRVAPFGGYGTQGTLTARFAHTWMGPAIGTGFISQPDDPTAEFPVRSGFLFSGGIAAVSRLVAPDESAPPLPDDFQPTPWAFEPPGVWLEIRWIRVSRGALGLGAMGGVQTGAGKIFYYGGATVSGFY